MYDRKTESECFVILVFDIFTGKTLFWRQSNVTDFNNEDMSSFIDCFFLYAFKYKVLSVPSEGKTSFINKFAGLFLPIRIRQQCI